MGVSRGPSIEGVTPGHFEMMSPEISPTQRDVRRSWGRRAAQTEDALTVALGFLNRWSEVRVLPGPPSKSANLLKYLHDLLLASEGPQHLAQQRSSHASRPFTAETRVHSRRARQTNQQLRSRSGPQKRRVRKI